MNTTFRTLSYDTFPTPLGEFSIAVNRSGAVVASAFGNLNSLLSRTGKCHVIRDPSLCAAARVQLEEYLAGERREFDVPLAPPGTEFQQSVWQALREIPYGETRSYGELAAQLGNPQASRAIGRANATNPVCVLIPCHRVIGADRSLTGFAFGEEVKRRLLELEGAAAVTHSFRGCRITRDPQNAPARSRALI